MTNDIQNLNYFIISLFKSVLDKNGIFEYRIDDHKKKLDQLGCLCFKKDECSLPIIIAERYEHPNYWEVFFGDFFGYENGSCIVNDTDEYCKFYFKYLEAFKDRLKPIHQN